MIRLARPQPAVGLTSAADPPIWYQNTRHRFVTHRRCGASGESADQSSAGVMGSVGRTGCECCHCRRIVRMAKVHCVIRAHANVNVNNRTFPPTHSCGEFILGGI